MKVRRKIPVVGVSSGTIPVTLNGFGVKRNHDSSNLSDPLFRRKKKQIFSHQEQIHRNIDRSLYNITKLLYLKNITSSPDLIAGRDSDRWSDLKLPLAGHHLAVNPTDVDSGVKASLVVCIDDITSKSLIGTNTTVVWALISSNR